MDPLFERRELVRNIHLDAKFLQRNIDASLIAQLRMKYEGICVAEGYIQRQSIVIVEHSLGRTNLIKGGLDYTVRFQADLCMPHPGQVFRAPVTLKSKIGLNADITPLKVLLPRDLHIGNNTFDDIQEKQEIEFEVVGARFQQGDDSIVVLGKLRNIIEPAKAQMEGEDMPESVEPMIAAPTGRSNEGSDKRVVTVDVSTTKLSEGGGMRRTRIKAKADSS
jgi:DNA-directed RNA polymerase subunit E'/Rpb7